MSRIIIVLLLITASLSATTKESTIVRGKLEVAVPEDVESDDFLCDTIADASATVSLTGYDKPLRASRETLLVTNNDSLDRTLSALEVRIRYVDTQGRMLHERTAWLTCDSVPAGATRQASVVTWDIQRSYYYIRGAVPRTANVTPYDVRIRPLRAVFLP